MNTEKNSYTIIFAIIMVVVVGSVLAGLFGSLNGAITENKRKEKQQNILFAMGVTKATVTGVADDSTSFVDADAADELFNKYITGLFIVQGNKASKSDAAFDIDLKKESQNAKSLGYVRKLPLFVGEKDNEKFYIVPVRGKGLWDAIWGYVAMEKDLKTIKGVYFDHKGETPGLGANIKEPFFRDDFAGESLYSNNNFAGVTVAKGNNDPKNERKGDNKVDAIAGATITGDGVTAMLKKDLRMYLPYFNTIKTN